MKKAPVKLTITQQTFYHFFELRNQQRGSGRPVEETTKQILEALFIGKKQGKLIAPQFGVTQQRVSKIKREFEEFVRSQTVGDAEH